MKEYSQGVPFPYLPDGREIEFVSEENEFMGEAKKYAMSSSLDKNRPNGTVLVKEGKIIGRGANGSNYHIEHGCERVRLNIPTGQGYDLCEGCHPKNHGEPKAIKDAEKKGFDTKGSDVYLWGHWWCCKSCWDNMIRAGIKNVYIMEGSKERFDKRTW